ncbi:MAG: response regulator [Anaerolineae bacterium]|nr:response regulator [Anaerolineae bacterium]
MTAKILIVEDNLDLVSLMKRALEMSGYQVYMAVDGKKGMRAFYETRPDLVILDVVMPYLDGFEVCQRIREMADTPILMLTAKDSEEDILKAIELGADDYLSKTFDISVLLNHVRVLLEQGPTKSSKDSPTIN